MESTTDIQLLSLEPYRHLFPTVTGIDHTVKKGASVSDTVKFIPAIVRRDSWHVQKYVDQELKGLSTYEACKKLWHFVKYHINYKKDERGSEQVRSGRRLIHDGEGDCDCFTTFIDKCLYLLKIPFINRITKYKEDYFQHIYPIVPTGKGKYITMDCVVGKFNYEEPFSEKEDYPMDLQYLDGIDTDTQPLIGIDAQDLFGSEKDLDDLGRLFKRRSPEKKARAKQRHKNFGKKLLKVVNKINKVNPATALLRAGILVSMKTNLAKVAESLRWAYATPQFAASKGMDMSKYAKLKTVLTKIEKIFYGAGGKPENLKKAILTGRGNRHHEVAGLGNVNQYTLPQLLGGIYDDEFVNEMQGTQGLGELGVVTATAVAAASGAIATIAALIKSIGNLFPKKNGNASPDNASDAGEGDNGGGGDAGDNNPPSDSDPGSSPIPDSQTDPPSDPGSEPDPSEPSEPESSEDPGSADQDNSASPAESPEDSSEVAPSDNTDGGDGEAGSEEGTSGILPVPMTSIKTFYQKNKKWLVPVGIAAVAITAALLIRHFSTKNNEEQKPSDHLNSVNGTPHRGRKKKRGGKRHTKESVIALM